MISIEEYKEFFGNITPEKNDYENKFNREQALINFDKNLLFFIKVCKKISYYPDDLEVILKYYPKENNKHFWNFLKIIVLDNRISQDPDIFKGLLLILENLMEVANKEQVLGLLRTISQKQNIKKLCDKNTKLFLEFFIKIFDKLLHSTEVCV
ncbi:hypothetical protein [Tepidibacter formicigenes]|uniref:Uncharacterized protein n=1 Tax=Tepidibacter formicigenes DSM 15518 TaxID=1123349 RepID=A0A1M6JES2_9FIRM|nr:hypothetical protein [Tepidibacter formicigenes]SHJ45236.1 hypothetical protein SAMN02744037_00104 [Tepidibacter formicigenes DSM 15518]